MGLNKYFFDTYALFAMIEGRASYAKYLDEKVATSIFNLVELYFLLLRDFGEKKARELYFKFQDCVVDVDSSVVFDAMKLRLSQRHRNLSYADCIGYACAKRHGVLFLTGDSQFKDGVNVAFVE